MTGYAFACDTVLEVAWRARLISLCRTMLDLSYLLSMQGKLASGRYSCKQQDTYLRCRLLYECSLFGFVEEAEAPARLSFQCQATSKSKAQRCSWLSRLVLLQALEQSSCSAGCCSTCCRDIQLMHVSLTLHLLPASTANQSCKYLCQTPPTPQA